MKPLLNTTLLFLLIIAATNTESCCMHLFLSINGVASFPRINFLICDLAVILPFREVDQPCVITIILGFPEMISLRDGAGCYVKMVPKAGL